MKKETFKVMEKYHLELIEELIDSFHFEKYREKQLEIDAILKKRILSHKNCFFTPFNNIFLSPSTNNGFIA